MSVRDAANLCVATRFERPLGLGETWPRQTSLEMAPALETRDWVVFLGSPWSEEAEAWNRICRENNSPRLLVIPLNDGAVVGPAMFGRSGSCLECLKTQHQIGALDSSFRLHSELESGDPLASLSQTQSLVERRGIQALLGHLWRLGRDGEVIASMRLARFPDCAGCAPLRSPAEVFYATQLFRPTIRGDHGTGAL